MCNLPRESAVYRSVFGEAAAWSPEMHRLTDLAELMRAGNWQRGGGRGAKPPTIPRPQPKSDDVQGGPLDE